MKTYVSYKVVGILVNIPLASVPSLNILAANMPKVNIFKKIKLKKNCKIQSINTWCYCIK